MSDQRSASETEASKTFTSERVDTYLFSSDKSAPRRRRQSDYMLLIIMSAGFVLLGWAASLFPPIDKRAVDSMSDLPSWIRSLAWFGFTGSFLVILALITVVFVRGGWGQGVVRDILFALLLISLFGVVAGRLVSEEWPNFLPEFNKTQGVPTYPTMRIASVTAITWVLHPYVTYPVQRILRLALTIAIVAPLVLTLTTMTGLFGALALGALSVASVRVVFGSPEGLPPVGRLQASLGRMGLAVTDLAYLDQQPGTVGLATARCADGREILIEIYGQDAARAYRTDRIWKALWYKSPGQTAGSGRLARAQQEALALLISERAGVSVPEVIRGSEDIGGDILLVLVNPPGTALGELDAESLDSQILSEMWQTVSALGEANVAHGAIGPDTVLSGPDGVSIVKFRHATAITTDRQLATDAVALLASTAAVVGDERAISAAVSSIGPDRLEQLGPYVQDAIIEPVLRKRLRGSGVKLSSIRKQLAETLGIESQELVEVRRISWTDVAMLVGILIAGNALISQFANVDMGSLLDDLKSASIGWLLAAFLIRIANYTVPYMGLKAVVKGPLPFAPTALVQSAKSYVGLILPSTVGSVSMDVAYLQKLGTPPVVAAAQGPVIGFCGFLVEVSLLLVAAWAVGQDLQTSDESGFSVGPLIALAAFVVVVGLIVVALVPKFRNKILPPIKQAWGGIKDMLSTPEKIARIFGSELLQRLISALALGAAVVAFGESLSYPALLFASVGTGLLAGLAPTPGGVGVAEATLTALLTTLGIEADLAFTIAITYRIVTSYIPPVLGFFSLSFLRRQGYL